jgi:hypothetical protein
MVEQRVKVERFKLSLETVVPPLEQAETLQFKAVVPHPVTVET